MSKYTMQFDGHGYYTGPNPLAPTREIFKIDTPTMRDLYVALRKAHPELSEAQAKEIMLDCDYHACRHFDLDYFDTSEDDFYNEGDPQLTYNKATDCFEYGTRYIVPTEVINHEIDLLHGKGVPGKLITRGKRKGRRVMLRMRNPQYQVVRVKYWDRRYELACCENDAIDTWGDFLWVHYSIDIRIRRPGLPQEPHNILGKNNQAYPTSLPQAEMTEQEKVARGLGHMVFDHSSGRMKYVAGA